MIATRCDDGQLDARDRPRVALSRRLFGNDPRADRHHGGRDQPRVREALRGAWPRQPRGGIVLVVLIETHSLPTLVRCYPCSFTFYVSDPSASFRSCAS